MEGNTVYLADGTTISVKDKVIATTTVVLDRGWSDDTDYDFFKEWTTGTAVEDYGFLKASDLDADMLEDGADDATYTQWTYLAGNDDDVFYVVIIRDMDKAQ